MPEDLRLTDTQRSILEALCRSGGGESRFAPPPTNQEIADELFLSVDAIKAHLRVLFRKFGIEDLPHNQKRARLVELAHERGVVGEGRGGPGGEGRGEEPAAGAEEPEGPHTVAVPAERAPSGEAAGPKHEVPRIRRPGRLVVTGVVAAVVAAGLAALLVSGGDDPDRPARGQVVAAVKLSCKTALAGLGALAPDAAPNPSDMLGAVSSISQQLAAIETPAGDSGGLDAFRSGIAKATTYARIVADGSINESSAPNTVFAQLTISAGLIQAGVSGYKLGPDCLEIGSRVGRIQPTGP